LDNSLSPIHLLHTVRCVAAALRDDPPHFIHAHSAKGGAVARMVGVALGLPVVYTVHGFGFKAAAPWPQRWAARLAEFALAPLTAQMICVSDGEARMAWTLPIRRSHVHVIRNGIADTPLRSQPDAPVSRVIMTARLAAPKRPDILIKAAADGALTPDTQVVLAGDGPQRSQLEHQAAGSPATVRFAGNVDNVPELLADAQLFVLFSDHEGLPISVLEAMRAGLPILASDLPGIREQIQHGESGWLVDHHDTIAVRDALHMLATDASRRQTLGVAARRRYEAQFEATAMVERTYAIYQQVLLQQSQDSR
jgi:glycosyltransferase involved in cell wall biosynthesis